MLSWLFLYNGTFSDADEVEFMGTEIDAGGRKFVLVEKPKDYIRNLSSERRQ